MTSPTQDAIGALKLVPVHLDHPTVVPAPVLRDAAAEAIQRLEQNQPHADQLGELYQKLFAVTPRGHVPYVTLTQLPNTPYGAVITNAAGNLVTSQIAKTIDGLVELIGARLGRGYGG